MVRNTWPSRRPKGNSDSLYLPESTLPSEPDDSIRQLIMKAQSPGLQVQSSTSRCQACLESRNLAQNRTRTLRRPLHPIQCKVCPSVLHHKGSSSWPALCMNAQRTTQAVDRTQLLLAPARGQASDTSVGFSHTCLVDQSHPPSLSSLELQLLSSDHWEL